MLSFVNSHILSPVVTTLLLLAGVYFTFRLRLSPARIFKALTSKSAAEGISPFRALTVALAGTLGVGNIVGVASAISLGGPGAVFWMWVSGCLVMALKYAEVALAVKYRRAEEGGAKAGGAAPAYYGGPFYYIRDGLGFSRLAKLYAAVLALDSFALGCVIQTKAAADGMAGAFSIPKLATGAAVGLLMLAVTLFGISGISEVTVRLIPFLTLGYAALSLCIILPYSVYLPEILAEIVSSAFLPETAPGAGIAGLLGIFNFAALRYGVARGIFSNEAGCGSSGIAHAAADTPSAAEQGAWGVFEVFADTIVLCGLTAFVILIAQRLFPGSAALYGGGMEAVTAAYGKSLYSVVEDFLGASPEFCDMAARLAVAFISSSVCMYALATVITWSHYGAEALRFLLGKHSGKLRAAYLCLSAAFCAAGSLATEGAAWDAADLALGLMIIINTVCVLKLRGEVPYLGGPEPLRLAKPERGGGQMPRKKSEKKGNAHAA